MVYEDSPPTNVDLNADPSKLDPNDEMPSDTLVANFLELNNQMSGHNRRAIQVTFLRQVYEY